MTTADPGTGRVVDAALQLLDRQIVDRSGTPVAKVDDLELEIAADGDPHVVALLCGPPALGPRIGGRLGSFFVAIAHRMSSATVAGPRRIPFALVADIDAAVELACDKSAIEPGELEVWVRTNIIRKIPGAGHAPE